jgi:Endonuclease NucS
MKQRKYDTKEKIINRLKEILSNGGEVNPESLKKMGEGPLYTSMLALFTSSEKAYEAAGIDFKTAYKRQQKQKEGWTLQDLIDYWWKLYNDEFEEVFHKYLQKNHQAFFKGMRKVLEVEYDIIESQYRYFVEEVIGMSYDEIKKRKRNGEKEDEEDKEDTNIAIGKKKMRSKVNDIADSNSFPTESHLRDFISSNINNIPFFKNELFLFKDEEGKNGIEYRTEAGIIDILAIDRNKNFYVIELKAKRGSDIVCGQISRYIGWVKKNLADLHNTRVSGIIIANEVDEKLIYATYWNPDITVLEYKINLDINMIELQP